MLRLRKLTVIVFAVVICLGIPLAGSAASTDRRPQSLGGPAMTEPGWARLSTGGTHSCGTRLDHTLWCWGSNGFGQLGLGDTTDRTTPTQVGVDHDWRTVRTGSLHTCGIRIDHTLWCWGYNGKGQLGLGDRTDRYVPTRVDVDADWLSVRTGGYHTCGIRRIADTGNRLFCWGHNDQGQLGIGGVGGFFSTPSPVSNGADFASLSAGYSHTCGIRLNHTLWCWGSDTHGELGLGDTQLRDAPAREGSDRDWASVRPGSRYTCATRLDHTLWCWGSNDVGQLGLGDTTDRDTPTQVGSGTDWTVISTGAQHTCATRLSHTLWCWGSNHDGQLGLGDRIDRHAPTEVSRDSTWVRVSAGTDGYHTCGIQPNHSLWCWGRNDHGQLGLGDTDRRLVPNRVR